MLGYYEPETQDEIWDASLDTADRHVAGSWPAAAAARSTVATR